jgi:hypothetical protein
MEFTIMPSPSERHPGIWFVPCPMCEAVRCGTTSQDAAESCMEHLACIHEPEIAQIDENQEGGCDERCTCEG